MSAEKKADHPPINRRQFIKVGAAAAGALGISSCSTVIFSPTTKPDSTEVAPGDEYASFLAGSFADLVSEHGGDLQAALAIVSDKVRKKLEPINNWVKEGPFNEQNHEPPLMTTVPVNELTGTDLAAWPRWNQEYQDNPGSGNRDYLQWTLLAPSEAGILTTEEALEQDRVRVVAAMIVLALRPQGTNNADFFNQSDVAKALPGVKFVARGLGVYADMSTTAYYQEASQSAVDNLSVYSEEPFSQAFAIALIDATESELQNFETKDQYFSTTPESAFIYNILKLRGISMTGASTYFFKNNPKGLISEQLFKNKLDNTPREGRDKLIAEYLVHLNYLVRQINERELTAEEALEQLDDKDAITLSNTIARAQQGNRNESLALPMASKYA